MNWNTTSPADRQRFAPEDIYAAGLTQHHLANTAYPIGHLTTMRPYRVTRRDGEDDRVAAAAWDGIDELSLYVHIPFCEKRCSFCEYTVVDPRQNQAAEDTYYDLLLREFEMWGQRHRFDAQNADRVRHRRRHTRPAQGGQHRPSDRRRPPALSLQARDADQHRDDTAHCGQ